MSLPRVCVTVAGRNLRELGVYARKEARHFGRTLGFVELRLDYLSAAALRDFAGITKLIRELRKQHVAVIATLRSAAAGGQFAGSAEEQLAVLEVAARAGASLVDLEVESAEHLGREVVRRLHKLAPLMVSFHDYQETPNALPMAVARLRHFSAELYKLVTMSRDPLDNAAVLDLLAESRGRLVAFTLGEMGRPTRLMALAAGSPFTYAGAVKGGVPGIGQIPAAEMRDMYRAARITRRTKIFGVAGHPVGHSLSPAIHNAGFAALEIDAVYLPFEVPEFDRFWKAFAPRLAGLSITLPHKAAAARAANWRDPLSDRAGAANTLVQVKHAKKGRQWAAYNTDVLGILGPLSKRIELAGARVLVAGAGGAARAAVFALRDAGCKVSIVARTPERAQALAAEAGVHFVDRGRLGSYDVILHATPLGMTPNVAGSFFEADELKARVLFETVYTPATTQLMRLAAARGLEVISGGEMFLAQASVQFELWTKKPAPLPAMRKALEKALRLNLRVK
jgi:3-dehydroquinate dehydratase/shikimate dehydrogenase